MLTERDRQRYQRHLQLPQFAADGQAALLAAHVLIVGVGGLGCPAGQYLAAAGMPVNIMEILAITQVFERRVINQYAVHGRADGIPELVKSTIDRIVEDEKWHIEWIREALKGMEDQYGAETIKDTLRRYTLADREVYANTAKEHSERLGDLRLAAK